VIEASKSGRTIYYLPVLSVRAIKYGRSCATRHRPEDNFGPTPATVEARYQALQARRRIDPNADDPLFRSIDADDFD
jgi:hypothetical protein